jgi:RimJ/RimL family protein N-acetyltransferase
MNLQIRYAIANDLENICKLFSSILEELSYYNALAKKTEKVKYSVEHLQNQLLADPFSIIIIELDDRLIGYCFSHFDDYTIWIDWFGIDVMYRRKGIGSLILKELEKSAQSRNCHKIWCDSRTENIASLALLLKNGYNIATTLKNHWYDQDFFIWQKLIKI